MFSVRYFELLKRTRPGNLDLIYIEMTEMFATYFEVAVMTGLAIAMVIVWQAFGFVAPGLTRKERRYV